VTATTPHPSGLEVGDYRLLAKIGEGGMGVVHLAQAADGSRVALKVLRPHIVGDDEARERLSREVASLRRVRSPRIAEVLDADPWGETPYVATRYVPGLSLHQHVRQEGPLAGDDLVFFAARLMEAVIAVHQVGVLHRDVKPSNVLLEGRAPVLIDFGLARLAEDPRITHTGWLLGTPGYLAPEILYGEDATTASDVHSWAATLVFAATGRPPFGTGPAMAIMDRVRRGEYDLSGVPDEVLPLVRGCLAPDPQDRPETASILASLRALSQPARPPGTGELTMPFAAVAGAADTDPTDVLGSEAPTTVTPRVPPTAMGPSVVQPPPVEPTRVAPRPTGPSQLDHQQPAYSPADPRRGPSALAKTQRVGLMLGLFALVASGFALAPYLAFGLVAVAALLVRTVSWTGQASRERQHYRGRRWYDGPLAVVTAPWYLVVATGGTLVLMLWAATLTFTSGIALLLFRPPLTACLLLMGGVLALSVWWGPGALRLRRPVRSLLVSTTRRPWTGWAGLGLLSVVTALVCYGVLTSGVQWSPSPGAPWRAGTLLGQLLRWV
jgi:serine/threonine protein kinase